MKVFISVKDVEEQEKREFLAMKRKVTRLQQKIERKSKQLDVHLHDRMHRHLRASALASD